VAIAKDATPYMHPRLHAVAGAGVPIPPDDQGQSLATIALKVALAFYLAAREEKAGLIEDAGDGARCKSTSTQPSNNNDGVPLALTLANWFRGSQIGKVMSTPEGSAA
jgi:hypothetical protein